MSQAWSPSASSGLIIFMASFLSQRLSYSAAQLSEQGSLCNPGRSLDRNPLRPGSTTWHRQENPARPEKEPSAWVLTSDSLLPGVSLGQLVEGGWQRRLKSAGLNPRKLFPTLQALHWIMTPLLNPDYAEMLLSSSRSRWLPWAPFWKRSQAKKPHPWALCWPNAGGPARSQDSSKLQGDPDPC